MKLAHNVFYAYIDKQINAIQCHLTRKNSAFSKSILKVKLQLKYKFQDVSFRIDLISSELKNFNQFDTCRASLTFCFRRAARFSEPIQKCDSFIVMCWFKSIFFLPAAFRHLRRFRFMRKLGMMAKYRRLCKVLFINKAVWC